MEQKSIKKRLIICTPLFLITAATLLYSLTDADGFKIIWRYFAWCNQTLSVFTLWAITVYLVREKKPYIITLIPALLMTCVSVTYICIAPEGFKLPHAISYAIGGTAVAGTLAWFFVWKIKRSEQ
jgi:carbon starvation protein CstA